MNNPTFGQFTRKSKMICNHHIKCDFCFNEEISEDNELAYDFYKKIKEKGWRFINLWQTSRKKTSITKNEGLACPVCIKEFENLNN